MKILKQKELDNAIKNKKQNDKHLYSFFKNKKNFDTCQKNKFRHLSKKKLSNKTEKSNFIKIERTFFNCPHLKGGGRGGGFMKYIPLKKKFFIIREFFISKKFIAVGKKNN
jgi:hypothetical protein